jgi:hypothetical protein
LLGSQDVVNADESYPKFCKSMKVGYLLGSFRNKRCKRASRIPKISGPSTQVYRLTILVRRWFV